VDAWPGFQVPNEIDLSNVRRGIEGANTCYSNEAYIRRIRPYWMVANNIPLHVLRRCIHDPKDLLSDNKGRSSLK
jgi:hypothetical protein